MKLWKNGGRVEVTWYIGIPPKIVQSRQLNGIGRMLETKKEEFLQQNGATFEKINWKWLVWISPVSVVVLQCNEITPSKSTHSAEILCSLHITVMQGNIFCGFQKRKRDGDTKGDKSLSNSCVCLHKKRVGWCLFSTRQTYFVTPKSPSWHNLGNFLLRFLNEEK